MPARMDDARESGTRSSTPGVRGGAIWRERAVLALIVVTLGGTFNLVLAIHRHAATLPASPEPSTTSISQASEAPKPVSVDRPRSPAHGVSTVATPEQTAPKPAEVLPPPEDPTVKALAGLTKATASEVDAARDADRRAVALEAAREAAVAESRRWKRREMLVRQQIAGLAARADQLETAASALDAERDVLAKERDALKAALAKAGRRSGFAVLPYKGPNGTWRRPIVLECTAGSVTLQPKGTAFTAMDLSPIINPRLSPLVKAVAREMLHIQAADTPDGTAAVPYLVFLVRPSGIRAYYEARACLEPLGIAFGYELIEQDLAVNIPDFDNLASWDGTVPLELPLEPSPRAQASVAMNSPPASGNGTATRSRGDQPASTGWPESSSRAGQQSAGEPGNGDGTAPEDFVWPSRGRPNSANDRRVAAPTASSGNSGQRDGDGGGTNARSSSAGSSGSLTSDGPSGPFGGQAPSSAGAYGGASTLGSFGSGRYPVGGPGSSSVRGGVSGSGLSSDRGTGSSGSLDSGAGRSWRRTAVAVSMHCQAAEQVGFGRIWRRGAERLAREW